MSTMIIGGTGFLGSYLAKHLVQRNSESRVVLFDISPNPSRVSEIQDQVTMVRGDLLEIEDLLSAMKQYKVDRVAHLALIPGGATRKVADVPADKLPWYLKFHCMGTTNVFDACRIHGVDRVTYASSVAVHGATIEHDIEYNEDVAPRPNTLYGACKLWSEHIADVYYESYDLDVIGMRLTTVFGLGAGRRISYRTNPGIIEANPEFAVLPELAALGKPVVMPPDHLVTDWMYAPDAAEALYLGLTVKNPMHRVFNVCSERRPFGDVTAHLRRVLPDAQITTGNEHLPLFPLMDNMRLRAELNFEPRYTLEAGLDEYIGLARREAGLSPIATR